MLRSTQFFFAASSASSKKSSSKVVPLRVRLAKLQSLSSTPLFGKRFKSGAVCATRLCGSRLIFNISQRDKHLALLPRAHLVKTVQETLDCCQREAGSKHPLTQSMMRCLLGNPDQTVESQKKDLKHFSTTYDRNANWMVTKRDVNFGVDADADADNNGEEQDNENENKKSEFEAEGKSTSKQQKSSSFSSSSAQILAQNAKLNSFYDLMLRDWHLCKEIKNPTKRVCVIFHLISVNGYSEDYEPKQIQKAKEKVNTKSTKFLNSFAYAQTREFYCRRRLLTDGSLHQIMSTGEEHDLRKAAWILYFDAMFQRFPRRPKKDPAPDMYELWNQWQENPSARSLPFIERFVALLTHPHLDKMLVEAAKTGDAKARAIVDRNSGLFEYRKRTAIQVGTDPYNCRLEMNRRGTSLNNLSWQLERRRLNSTSLSSVPTYVAVLETSKPYRTKTDYNILKKAFTEAKDDGFHYAKQEY